MVVAAMELVEDMEVMVLWAVPDLVLVAVWEVAAAWEEE